MREQDAQEWREEGRSRFGADPLLWRFVCPECGNVQCGQDFAPYRGAGARAHTAYQDCIGRYNGRSSDETQPGCLFSTVTQPWGSHLEVIYGPGHSQKIMEFAPLEGGE